MNLSEREQGIESSPKLCNGMLSKVLRYKCESKAPPAFGNSIEPGIKRTWEVDEWAVEILKWLRAKFRSLLSAAPIVLGNVQQMKRGGTNAPGKTRTCSLRFRRPTLCPLSYRGNDDNYSRKNIAAVDHLSLLKKKTPRKVSYSLGLDDLFDCEFEPKFTLVLELMCYYWNAIK